MRFLKVPAEVRFGKVTQWCIYDDRRKQYVGWHWLKGLLGFSMIRVYDNPYVADQDVQRLNEKEG